MIMKRLLWGLIVLLLWAMPMRAQDMTPDGGYQEALVRIEDARVHGMTELNLSGLGLTELPPEIGQLTRLSWLRLDKNQLADLPPEIVQLPNLRALALAENQLTSLPPEVVQLSQLE